jgi:hypothetical protein
MAFTIKAEVRDPRAKSFASTAGKALLCEASSTPP